MAVHLKTIVEAFIKKQKNNTKLKEKIQKAFDAVVGKELARRATVSYIKGASVTVWVDSSPTLYQVRLLKNKILVALDENGLNVTKIYIKIGSR